MLGCWHPLFLGLHQPGHMVNQCSFNYFSSTNGNHGDTMESPEPWAVGIQPFFDVHPAHTEKV